MRRYLLLLPVILLAGCNRSIYIHDGVTDGDSFFLAQKALQSDDPVLQSWVSYSLSRSACQLAIGGPNPARATSFDCEYMARRHLVDTWLEQRAEHPDARSAYLDELAAIRNAGFLDEYTVIYFRDRDWQVPADVDTDAFRHWRRQNMSRHRPRTRWVGFWGFAQQQE